MVDSVNSNNANLSKFGLADNLLQVLVTKLVLPNPHM